MEISRIWHHLNAILATLHVALIVSVNGQTSTPCTASMINSFTPCFSFITGSSSNGSSPTNDCCNSLKSLVSDSVDCACLIITGNVPFSLPFSRNIAITLSQACNGGVPTQCKASGVPLPPPGPILFGPTPPPTASAPTAFAPLSPRGPVLPGPTPPPTASAPTAFAPLSPRASKAVATAPPPAAAALETTSASSPVSLAAPTAKSGNRPAVSNLTSASYPSHISLPCLLSLLLMCYVTSLGLGIN